MYIFTTQEMNSWFYTIEGDMNNTTKSFGDTYLIKMVTEVR